MPGPPNELQRLWAIAVSGLSGVSSRGEDRRFANSALLRRERVGSRALLADAGGERSGVEATVCARDFEIHVDLVGAGEELSGVLRSELAEYLFSEDERPVAEIVLAECRARGLRSQRPSRARAGSWLSC